MRGSRNPPSPVKTGEIRSQARGGNRSGGKSSSTGVEAQSTCRSRVASIATGDSSEASTGAMAQPSRHAKWQAGGQSSPAASAQRSTNVTPMKVTTIASASQVQRLMRGRIADGSARSGRHRLPLDQQASSPAGDHHCGGSLNANSRCLKIVDTFRKVQNAQTKGRLLQSESLLSGQCVTPAYNSPAPMSAQPTKAVGRPRGRGRRLRGRSRTLCSRRRDWWDQTC